MASAAPSLPADPWAAIHQPHVPLVVEPGTAPDAPWVDELLRRAPDAWHASGPADTIAYALPDAPEPLRAIIADLASRFAALIGTHHVSVRVEGVTGNACTRMHADYTDVRLIQTLAGPGTEYLVGDDPSAPTQQLPTGHIGLFKGRTYPGAGPGRHAPCLHRSPPIAGSGVRRLVLVIDTAGPAGLEPDSPVR
jgi:hypothetical protein